MARPIGSIALGALQQRRRVHRQDLQRRLVVCGRLVRAADRHGLVAGLDARAQGHRQVVGRAGVAGQLGRGRVGARGGQGGDVGRVPADPLAGQQVAVDRLGQQGVPEGVAVADRQQDVGVDRRRAGPASKSVGRRRRRRRAASCDTRRPATEAARTTCRVLSSSRSSRTSSRSARSVGSIRPPSPAAATSSSAKNALPSARATIRRSSSSRIGPGAGPDQRANVLAGSGLQGDPADLGQPGPLGRGARSGWRRCRSSVRYDATMATGPAAGRVNSIGQQVAGRLVGPVDVLDQDEQRPLGGQRPSAAVDGVDQVAPAEPVGALRAIGGAALRRAGRALGGVEHPVAGHQPGQRGLGGDQPVGDGGLVAGDGAEQLAERQVGQGAVAEVEAVTDHDPPAGVDRAVAQLGEQPGLAQAGVAGEQEHGGAGRGSSPAGTPTSPISRLSESSSSARPTSGLRGSASGGTPPSSRVSADNRVGSFDARAAGQAACWWCARVPRGSDRTPTRCARQARCRRCSALSRSRCRLRR